MSKALHESTPAAATAAPAAVAPVPGRVQRRAAIGGDVDSGTVHAAAARGVATPSARLPFAESIQRAFGRHDSSQIRVHDGPDAGATAGAIGAHGYATGNDIVLAPNADLFTVAHEAAHVIQQRAGISPDAAHERHADAVAEAVVAGRSAESLLDEFAPRGGGGAPVVQRRVTIDSAPLLKVTPVEGIAAESRPRQVLDALIDSENDFPFASLETLKEFVTELARVDWNRGNLEATAIEFARSRVGKHVWSSDNRMKGKGTDVRVTRTNVLRKNQYLGLKHDFEDQNMPRTMESVGEAQHLYSAMGSSLSPVPFPDETTPNTDIHGDFSNMNCEEFVAYSLWGGGQIHDWELKLLFAVCARKQDMKPLYEAMGLLVAQPLVLPGELPPTDSVLFDMNNETVIHMLLFGGGKIYELNAGKVFEKERPKAPAEWRVRETDPSDGKFKFDGRAAPVSAVRAAVTTAITTHVPQEVLATIFAPQQSQNKNYGKIGFFAKS